MEQFWIWGKIMLYMAGVIFIWEHIGTVILINNFSSS